MASTPSTIQDTIPASLVRRRRVRAAVQAGAFVGLVALVAASAVVTKEARGYAHLESLSAVTDVRAEDQPAVEIAAASFAPEVAAAQPAIVEPLIEEGSTDGIDAGEVSEMPAPPPPPRPRSGGPRSAGSTPAPSARPAPSG